MPASILVVEDEPAIQELIAVIPAAATATPCAGLSPSSAARSEAISQQLPDLVVLDWMLPGMSGGIEFARGGAALRQAHAGRGPLIMLTARADEREAEGCSGAGNRRGRLSHQAVLAAGA